MEFNSKTGDLSKLHTPCLVLGVYAKQRLGEAAKQIDEASSGRLAELLKMGQMDGEAEQMLMLYELPGVKAERVLLVGMGKRKESKLAAYRKQTEAAFAELARQRVADAVWALHAPAPGDADDYRCVRDTLTTLAALAYRFDQCKSDAKAPKHALKRVTFWSANKSIERHSKLALTHGRAIVNGMALAKDLGNLPGNICTPSYLAQQAQYLSDQSKKLKVDVLEEKDMEKLGMGALLSVSHGSRQAAKLIIMDYRGAAEKQRPTVLVGKGLTFDAGGISLKPSEAMDEMKYDMCGGASVIGVMRMCVELELPINLVGVVPASENLPDGDANKPGDIVTSMSGQTIEILNTDAEGRLILCDALTYSERFDPEVIIDIATLTGAVIVGLGKHPSGLLSNDQDLAQALIEAGERSGDRVWQLPLWDEYQSQLDSRFADMANIGGRAGGSITAACFLSRFTKKMRWAHLDIAGTAWFSGDKKGSTGRPVPLLSQFLLERSGLIKS
jgi:leucyl aminopeptidase